MSTKRPPQATAADDERSKKQKTASDIDDSQLADGHAKSLVDVTAGLKADEVGPTKHIHEQHAAKDKEITILKASLRSAHDLAEHETNERRRVSQFLKKASIAQDEAEKKMKTQQTEHRKTVKKLQDEVKQLKEKQKELEDENEELVYQNNAVGDSIDEYRDLKSAATKVKAMFDGMTMQNMGLLGEALGEMDTALGIVNRAMMR